LEWLVARPTRISDERILAAARELFLQKGARASTVELARLAGVAEGTIFRRFPTKEALLRAALQGEETDPAWVRTLRDAQDDPQLDIKRTLLTAGTQAVEFFRMVLPVHMMRWSASRQEDSPPEFLLGPNSPPLRALKTAARFFEQAMRDGRMRKHDPEIVARVFLGSIQNYVFFELLLRAQEQTPMPVQTYLRGVIKLIWTGAEPYKLVRVSSTRSRTKE
jgi:AcrR family transcriptional regulator